MPHRPRSDITYTGNHKTIIDRKIPQTQTHTCKQKALDPQPHTQGSCHLPKHNTIILPMLGTETEDGRNVKHNNICTATRGASLAFSPTTDPRPPIPPRMRRSPNTYTPVCHSIETHRAYPYPTDHTTIDTHAHQNHPPHAAQNILHGHATSQQTQKTTNTTLHMALPQDTHPQTIIDTKPNPHQAAPHTQTSPQIRKHHPILSNNYTNTWPASLHTTPFLPFGHHTSRWRHLNRHTTPTTHLPQNTPP